MKRKKFRPTESAQKAVAEMITALGFAVSLEEIHEICNEMYKKYNLHDDPFTHLPCSDKEYSEMCEEYSRQSMIDRFGYYE